MDIRGGFTELERYIKDEKARVLAKMREIGEEGVEYAINNGTYHNVTGRLRRSNESSADERGITISNTAPYAEEVETRHDVISGAALFIEKRCKEEFE